MKTQTRSQRDDDLSTAVRAASALAEHDPDITSIYVVPGCDLTRDALLALWESESTVAASVDQQGWIRLLRTANEAHPPDRELAERALPDRREAWWLVHKLARWDAGFTGLHEGVR